MDTDVRERMEQVRELAVRVWVSETEAEAWLRRPHGLLGGLPPIEVAQTEAGAQRVTRLLQRFFYGLPV